MIGASFDLAITVLVAALIGGLLVYLIRAAPFLPATYKQWAEWAIIAIAVLMVVWRVLLLFEITL